MDASKMPHMSSIDMSIWVSNEALKGEARNISLNLFILQLQLIKEAQLSVVSSLSIS